ncbi:hypothetical protein NT98_3459 [Bacillus cereus]|nr:hypothetical protein NT98_3459 [Bacillus cereus]AJI05727.1 hypothetical protein AQ16_410 [Bacillus cereus G9241]
MAGLVFIRIGEIAYAHQPKGNKRRDVTRLL